MYTLDGVSIVANFITAYEESQTPLPPPTPRKVSIKPSPSFSICNWFFVSKANRLDFYFVIQSSKNPLIQRCTIYTSVFKAISQYLDFPKLQHDCGMHPETYIP